MLWLDSWMLFFVKLISNTETPCGKVLVLFFVTLKSFLFFSNWSFVLQQFNFSLVLSFGEQWKCSNTGSFPEDFQCLEHCHLTILHPPMLKRSRLPDWEKKAQWTALKTPIIREWTARVSETLCKFITFLSLAARKVKMKIFVYVVDRPKYDSVFYSSVSVVWWSGWYELYITSC